MNPRHTNHAYIEQVFQRRMIEITKDIVLKNRNFSAIPFRADKRSMNPTMASPCSNPWLVMRNKKGW